MQHGSSNDRFLGVMRRLLSPPSLGPAALLGVHVLESQGRDLRGRDPLPLPQEVGKLGVEGLLEDAADEAPRDGEPRRDEDVVNEELRVRVGDLAVPPAVDLALEPLEVALHARHGGVDHLLAVDPLRAPAGPTG